VACVLDGGEPVIEAAMLSTNTTSTTPNTFPKLAAASIAANFADQMMLALLPLVLVAAGASAQTISTVVAAHAAAWLIVSMPVGAYADAMSRRTIMTLGAGSILVGAGAGAAALSAQFSPPWLLALCAFAIASGVVMLILSVFALVPRSVETAKLASSNALLEFGRAVACIAAPIIAAALVTRQLGGMGFALAFGGGIVALMAARLLPREIAPASGGVSLLQSIREGAAFVLGEPILRAIAFCAIAWNSAFFALTAIFAPYAKSELGMSIADIGNAWSVYGVGLLLGSLAAAPMIQHLPTRVMFMFGPVASCVSVVIMLAGAGRDIWWPVAVGFFGLGFGPMTWLVLQTSVRQIVTPNALLGRVGATITTTIYGVRPIGALMAGWVASIYGAPAALWLSAGLFFVSCLMLMLSPAARLKSMPKAA
jgi:predicted MFS family arabinose efflux permease